MEITINGSDSAHTCNQDSKKHIIKYIVVQIWIKGIRE